MVTLYTVTLTVACCVAVALAVASERRGRSADSSWMTASTLAVLAASCATLSTLAYAMSGPNDENLLPLVIGDVSMPLAVGLLLATVRRSAGERRSFLSLTLVVSFAVGATTVLLSPAAGQAAKLLALALLSLLTALTCLRSRLPRLGALLIGLTMAAYAAYCLLRFALPLALGPDHRYAFAFDRAASTIVAAVAVGLVAWGTITIIRRSPASETSAIVSSETLTNWIDALLAQRRSVAAVAVSAPALPLHRAAFGRSWANDITHAVTEATEKGMPTGSVIGRVAPGVLVALQFGPTVDLEATRSSLQHAYERALPQPAPTEAPDLEVELLSLTSVADLRLFARRARSAARHAMTSQGV
jgi:hypothetical protein